MRFKRGNKVEVMSRNEVPSRSWRWAEIVSGNGHNYSVRFGCYSDTTSEVIVERVSRKAIRPCPPPVEGVESWAPGDVVEVFDDVSWKIAMVLKVLGRDCYLVRLIGSAQEFGVHKSNIRVRQSWQDDKWVVIGKGSGGCEDEKFSKLSTSNCYQKMSFQLLPANVEIELQAGDDCLAVQNNFGLQESRVVSSRTLKRASPYCSSHVEAYSENFQKIKAIEKEGKRQRVAPRYPSPLLQKAQSWRHACLASKGLKMMLWGLPRLLA